MKPKISVLVSARKNSKYLAKFLFGYFNNTANTEDTEILVMLNEHDTWNADLELFYKGKVRFFREDYNLGRAGLHVYFNDLLKHASGDWIIYFCEDHYIIYKGWDDYLRSEIIYRELDPKKVAVIVPVFDNAGTMNHIVSRGWVDALGDIGKHGWIDSYINAVLQRVFMERNSDVLIKNADMQLFHDFTHDDPSPMSDAHLQGTSPSRGNELPKFDTDEVREIVERDAQIIKQKLQEGL